MGTADDDEAGWLADARRCPKPEAKFADAAPDQGAASERRAGAFGAILEEEARRRPKRRSGREAAHADGGRLSLTALASGQRSRWGGGHEKIRLSGRLTAF